MKKIKRPLWRNAAPTPGMVFKSYKRWRYAKHNLRNKHENKTYLGIFRNKERRYALQVVSPWHYDLQHITLVLLIYILGFHVLFNIVPKVSGPIPQFCNHIQRLSLMSIISPSFRSLLAFSFVILFGLDFSPAYPFSPHFGLHMTTSNILACNSLCWSGLLHSVNFFLRSTLFFSVPQMLSDELSCGGLIHSRFTLLWRNFYVSAKFWVVPLSWLMFNSFSSVRVNNKIYHSKFGGKSMYLCNAAFKIALGLIFEIYTLFIVLMNEAGHLITQLKLLWKCWTFSFFQD